MQNLRTICFYVIESFFFIEMLLFPQAATKATADLSHHADARLIFIKRLAEILLEMAKLLVAMVSEKKELPENFSVYLQVIRIECICN